MDPNWIAAHGGMMPQYHGQYGVHGYPSYQAGQMDGIPLPPSIGLGGDPLESILGPFPCVRLRNLPHEATLEDVLLFFQGLVVLDVILQGNGEAFVIFANPMDYQMALQRDRQSMGIRYIEVYQGKRHDYYAAIANQHWNAQQQEQNVTSLGLDDDEDSPWNTGPTPAQSLSAGAGQIENRSGYGRKGSGSSRGGMMTTQGGVQVRRTGGGIQVGEHTGYLRMRGLPFSATKEEIFTFFEGYNPIQESIVLTYRNDGRATGEGYVQFDSPDDAKSAMVLHRKSMGSRYIELFISNKEEHSRAFARFSDR
jgi:heterogeneous nuclear ribonucleoprotein F/H